MCGGAPEPAPYVPPPKKEDPEVQEAIAKERELQLKRKGRQSTILTGPTGVGDNGTGKTLLGS